MWGVKGNNQAWADVSGDIMACQSGLVREDSKGDNQCVTPVDMRDFRERRLSEQTIAKLVVCFCVVSRPTVP